MKKTIKSILAMVMILCMLFTAAGCTESAGGEASEQQVAVDDSFFEVQTSSTTSTTSSEDGQTSSESSVTTSSQTSSTQATSSATSSTSSTGSTTVTTTVPEENKIGGKTWTEVLSSIPKKLRGTKIVMYNWNPASEYTGAPEVIENFTKQTGIKVEWQTITYANYFTKLPALVASGENIPDVARLRGTNITFMQSLQPLSVTGYDFSDEAWDQNLMDLYTFGDNTYATSLQNTHIGCVNLLFYNQALIEKYDLEEPYKLWKAGKWDWDKYIEMCREFKELSGNTTASNGEGHFSLYVTCFGLQGAIAYNGKKFYNAMKESNFLEVHQKLGDLYNKEKLFAMGGATNFNEGKVLFSIGSAVHLRRKNSYFGNLKNANTLMAVPMPEINGQKKYYQGLGEAEAYGIPEGASNVEAVPYFLRFFLDGANYELSTYFVNKQNLEVYNWCMNQSNKVIAYGYPSSMSGAVEGSIEVQTGAQMNTYINANYGVTDKAVKEYNEILETLKSK